MIKTFSKDGNSEIIGYNLAMFLVDDDEYYQYLGFHISISISIKE